MQFFCLLQSIQIFEVIWFHFLLLFEVLLWRCRGRSCNRRFLFNLRILLKKLWRLNGKKHWLWKSWNRKRMLTTCAQSICNQALRFLLIRLDLPRHGARLVEDELHPHVLDCHSDNAVVKVEQCCHFAAQSLAGLKWENLVIMCCNSKHKNKRINNPFTSRTLKLSKPFHNAFSLKKSHFAFSPSSTKAAWGCNRSSRTDFSAASPVSPSSDEENENVSSKVVFHCWLALVFCCIKNNQFVPTRLLRHRS